MSMSAERNILFIIIVFYRIGQQNALQHLARTEPARDGSEFICFECLCYCLRDQPKHEGRDYFAFGSAESFVCAITITAAIEA